MDNKEHFNYSGNRSKFGTHCLPLWAFLEGFTVERDRDDLGASLCLNGKTLTSITSICPDHWISRIYEFDIFLMAYKMGKESVLDKTKTTA